jgi:hypothetical protein
MERPLLKLVDTEPGLRRPIERLVDLVWLCAAWGLRERSLGVHPYALNTVLPGSDHLSQLLAKHLDLLMTFAHATGENLSEWKSEALRRRATRRLAELEELLGDDLRIYLGPYRGALWFVETLPADASRFPEKSLETHIEVVSAWSRVMVEFAALSAGIRRPRHGIRALKQGQQHFDQSEVSAQAESALRKALAAGNPDAARFLGVLSLTRTGSVRQKVSSAMAPAAGTSRRPSTWGAYSTTSRDEKTTPSRLIVGPSQSEA